MPLAPLVPSCVHPETQPMLTKIEKDKIEHWVYELLAQYYLLWCGVQMGLRTYYTLLMTNVFAFGE